MVEHAGILARERSIRIAFVVDQLHPGGAQRRLLKTANRLVECEGLHVGLFVRNIQPDQIRQRLSPRIHFRELDRRRRLDFGLLWSLRRELHAFRPDVVQAWQVWDQLWSTLAAPRRVPLIFSYWSSSPLHGHPSRQTTQLYYPRLCKSRAALHVFNSRPGIENWSRLCHLPRERCRYLPNYLEIKPPRTVGADERRVVRQQLGLDPGLPLLIAVGRLQLPTKGQDLLIAALPRVIDQIGPVNLLVVGDDIGKPESLETLRRLATRLGVGERVSFIGWREDVDALLAASDLFVLPSRKEGFPNALAEAIAQQVPVVSTRVGAVDEILNGGRLGVICEPAAESLAQAVSSALSDRERLREIARQAREHLVACYDPQRVIAAHRDLYLKVTEGKPP